MTDRERRVARRKLEHDARMAKAAEKRLQALFRKERDRVLIAVAAGSDPTKQVREKEWLDALVGIWQVVFRQLDADAKARPMADMKAQPSRELVALVQTFIASPSRAKEVARFLDDAANGISTTSQRRISTILTGTDADTLAAIRVNISKLYDTQWITGRASRIALDNVLRATATHEFELAQVADAGLGDGTEIVKQWLTAGDNLVRDNHRAAAGQTKRLNEPFLVGGSSLRYPRDPAGPVGETINCRCTMIQRRRRKKPKL